MIMSKAILTLIGLYEYDNELFDNLELPSGIDKSILVNNILLEAGEFSVLYPNPEFMKSQIGYWSKKNYRTFEKWIDALSIEYDPLYNYDRTEEWTDTGTSNDSGEASGNDNENSTVTGTSENDTNTLNKISAYDSSTLQNDTSSDVSFSGSDTSTGNTSRTNSNDYSNTNNYHSTHSARMYGNIGVTTSQQMLESELDIATWNLYQHITDLFLNEFCIMVY